MVVWDYQSWDPLNPDMHASIRIVPGRRQSGTTLNNTKALESVYVRPDQ